MKNYEIEERILTPAMIEGREPWSDIWMAIHDEPFTAESEAEALDIAIDWTIEYATTNYTVEPLDTRDGYDVLDEDGEIIERVEFRATEV